MIPVIAENRITGDYGEGGSVLADHETFGKITAAENRYGIVRIADDPIIGNYGV